MNTGRNLRLASAGTAAAAFAIAPAAAHAASEELVTKLADTNDNLCSPTDCSLREAVYEANQNPDGTTVRFQTGLSGTITLSDPAGQIAFDYQGGIEGPGADKLTIEQTVNDARVLSFPGAGVGFVDGVTVTGGVTSSSSGAGIRALQTNLTVTDSVVSGNVAGNPGGGIYVQNGSLTLDHSAVLNNQAQDGGAGILLDSSDGKIYASTVYGNGSGGILAEGGGINAISGSELTVRDSTITENYTYGFGGGISISGGDATLRNTVVWGNFSYVSYSDLRSDDDVNDTFDVGFSLIGSGEEAKVVASPGLLVGIDPELGKLEMNGGSTPTQLPDSGSPLIDQGSTGDDTDQRGLTRPVDYPGVSAPGAAGADSADIGAVEVQLPPPAPPGGGSDVTPAPLPKPRPRKACKKPKKKTPAAKKKFKKCKKKLRRRPA